MSSRAQIYRSWVEIDLDRFRHNWDEINKLVDPGVRVLQVVKADAYGHGAIEISKAAVKNGVYGLGVANADEGVQLRVGGVDAPIIILSPSTISEIDEIIKYNLIPSVSDIHFPAELNRKLLERGERIPVHIEVDTGMGRGGTIYNDAIAMIRKIIALPNIVVEGIFSHLSVGELKDEAYNAFQWNLFDEIIKGLEKEGIAIPIKTHIQQWWCSQLSPVQSGYGASRDYDLRGVPRIQYNFRGESDAGDELQNKDCDSQTFSRRVQHRIWQDTCYGRPHQDSDNTGWVRGRVWIYHVESGTGPHTGEKSTHRGAHIHGYVHGGCYPHTRV